jgi:O-antigen/teichoic acid export membrane protein
MNWMSSLPKEPPSPALYRKLFTFSGHALAISAVVLIINDRSEFVFLKHFCDIKQVAFYSVAFGLSEYLASAFLMFTGPIASEFMADYAQDEDRAGSKAAKAIRFVSMIVLPIQFGLAAISPALIRLAYGRAYLPAIPAVVVVAVLAVPKVFFGIVASIYKAADRQLIMLRYLVFAAIVNLTLDAILIPRFGTIGAAFGNGLSQTFAVVAMWGAASRLGHLRMQWQSVARIAVAAIGMASVVAVVCASMRPTFAIFLGPLLGILSYIVLLRILRPLAQQDVETFVNIGRRMPAPMRGITSLLFSGAAIRSRLEPDWKADGLAVKPLGSD